MRKVEDWAEWKRAFRHGQTPATYLSVANMVILTIDVYLFRVDQWWVYTYAFAGVMASYGVFTDQVAHILTIYGYDNYRKISWKQYISMFMRFRAHDQWGMIIVVIMLVLIGQYYFAIIPLADMGFMAYVHFYH